MTGVQTCALPIFDPDAPGCFVPTAIELKGGTVGKRATTTNWTEMMRHELGMPTVRRVIGWRCNSLKLLGLVIRPKRAPFGTEGAGAAGELGWDFPRNGKGSFAAMAASSNRHVSLLSVVDTQTIGSFCANKRAQGSLRLVNKAAILGRMRN